MDRIIEFVYKTIGLVPRVVLYLGGNYKTYDYFYAQITGLVRGVYNGYIAGEFIDVMANLISGQFLDAYQKAWFESGYEGDMPDYLQQSYQEI